MKPLFVSSALCLFAASASACPNLSGHYLLQGEDRTVRYTVRQRGCDRVEIDRINNYLGEESVVETEVWGWSLFPGCIRIPRRALTDL
jgi:hypothetical protein